MKLKLTIFLGVLILIGVIFYASSDFKNEIKSKSAEHLPRELIFEAISEIPYSHESKKEYVIKTNSDWINFNKKYYSEDFQKLDDLNIDFKEEMIIATFQGMQNSGGYEIKIIKIIEKEETVEVYIEEKTPLVGELKTQAFTTPYHIVKTQRIDKEIKFIK